MDYLEKYLKYKNKYLELKYQYGGGDEIVLPDECIRKPIPIQKKKYSEPWSEKKSKLLFIALTISDKSSLGKEIEQRSISMGLESPYNTKSTDIGNEHNKFKLIRKSGKFISKSKEGRLVIPHVTLLQVRIKKDSVLDNYLRTTKNYTAFAKITKAEFLNNYTVSNSAKPLQLYSNPENYKILRDWFAIVYNQYIPVDLSNNIDSYRNKIINELLKINYNKSNKGDNYKNNEVTQTKLNEIGNGPTIQFTHFKVKQVKDANIAVSDFYMNLEPHISLCKISQNKTLENLKQEFQRGKSVEMSYVNLWPQNIKKKVNKIDQEGSLEYLFFAYGDYSMYFEL
jgi:hypothetical protein